ncbi:hypothetical protein [Clostridium tagluense]|nr:hypothetical protein [Clostridium tagluense]MBW9154873.1 hypothetical protein [Clostridium tagluense]WLC64328.1 hypothetical protein KTC93_15820 [Clostridium tagluense]
MFIANYKKTVKELKELLNKSEWQEKRIKYLELQLELVDMFKNKNKEEC